MSGNGFADLAFFEQLADTIADCEIVTVEEWGRKLRLNKLDSATLIKLCADEGDPLDVARRLLAHCAADEEGRPIFADPAAGVVLIERAWSLGVQIGLGNKALALNGLKRDAAKLLATAKKN